MATGLEQRKSPRAFWHDYAGGLYFVTIVTHERRHFFGQISNDEMHFSPLGSFLDQQMHDIPSHYHYAQAIKHVVMPNHLHCLLYINHDSLPHDMRQTIHAEHFDNPADFARQNIGWLSVIVGGLKSSVTKFAHQSMPQFKWQSRYHDRIIRNRDEFLKVSDYIDNNVFRWNQDCFYDAPAATTVGTGRALSEKPRDDNNGGQGTPCPYNTTKLEHN